MARDCIRCCFLILVLHLTVFYGRNYSIQYDKIVKEGDSFVWNCGSDEGSWLVWKRNNQWVAESWILSNGSLFITSAVKDLHEGEYRCCVRKTRPQNCGEPQNLLVGSSIAVIIRPREVWVNEGESWKWTCIVSSTENADIRWQRNGQWLVDSTPQTFPNGSLYFQSVNRDIDEGFYRCCATNSVGTFCSKKAKINVSKLPLLTVQPQELEARIGTAARIRCHSSGTPPHQVPYSWLHNGNNFLQENTSRVNILPQGIIQFTHILEEDEGVYQCFDGYSQNNTANATLKVIVSDLTDTTEHVPLLNTAPSSQEKAISESALLECLPHMEHFTVTWTWNGGRVNSNATIAGKYNLFFENLSVLDSGIYTCNVTDETTGRSAQASGSLLVQEPPVITSPMEAVIKGRLAFPIMLRCPAGDRHPPDYTWLFNGEPLSPGRRIVIGADGLRIRNPTGTDTGVYQCFVSNVAGEDASRTEVRFKGGAPSPPRNVTVRSVTSESFFIQWDTVRGAKVYSVFYYKWPDGDDEETPISMNFMNVTRGVTPFTKYGVFVVAFNSKSGSNHSNLIIAETSAAKPLASPFFFLSVTPSLSVNISWLPLVKELRQGTILKYLLEYKLGSGSVIQVDVPANVSHYEATGMQRGGQYSFRSAAATSVGNGMFSEWRNVTIGGGSTLAKPLPQVEISNGTSVSIVWKQPPRNITVEGYWLAVTNLQHEPISSVRKINAPIFKAVWGNLEPDTDYEIHIAAFSQYGDGPRYVLNFMTQSTVLILTKCPVLPPFNLYSSKVTSMSLILNWSDPVTNLEYKQFRIEYHPSLVTDSEPSVLVIMDHRVRQQEFTDLQPYTTYSFRISVGCNGGFGEFSVSHQITTLEDVPATPPANVEAHPVDPHKVKVYWLPPVQPNGVIIYYVVLYNTNQEDVEPNWRVHRSHGTTQQSIIDELDSGTRYFFKVRAGTQVGDGPLTDPVPAFTMYEEGKEDKSPMFTNKQLGILIGVFLALLCIILCSSLIIYKYRCLDAQTQRSGGTQFNIRPNGMVHPKCPCSETQGEDSLSMLHSSCNRGRNGHIRTTFHNSGHYVIDYPETCSTQLLSQSQESSQSSTSTQSPPLDTGQQSSLPNWRRAGVPPNGTHGNTLTPPPLHSQHCSQTIHLEGKNSAGGSNCTHCPKDDATPGETSSLLPPVLSPNSQSRNVKETMV